MTAGLTVVPHESSSSRLKRFTVGGLVFDTHGNHFANELEGRDYVIGEMWKDKRPFGLAMTLSGITSIALDVE